MVEPAATHRPVMLAETLAALAPGPGRLLLDGTVGLGGHAQRWLELAPGGRVVGLDRDAEALARAAERLAPWGGRVKLLHESYKDAPQLLAGETPPDAVLLDLGLGSHQLDDPDRGFSFRHDGPLDMRFDRERPGVTAAELLAQTPEPELARLLVDYGEERAARKLARLLVERRQAEPLRTTRQLADLVRSAVPARGRQRIDPATRTFQALRIAVNDELAGLDDALEQLVRLLRPGGRIAVLAFHSLEDRVVKRTLRRLAAPCRCRRGDPCTCGALELLELPERRAAQPAEEEKAANPRARSARMRWGVRR